MSPRRAGGIGGTRGGRRCLGGHGPCSNADRLAEPGRSRCRNHALSSSSGWDRKPASRDLAYIDPAYKRNREILLADHPPCSLRYPGCTGTADTIDHIVAPRLGGTNEMSNLRPACRKCNEARGRAAGNETKRRRAAQRRQK